MKKHTAIFFFISTILLSKCIEPIPIENRPSEQLLVIEALLTNELKNHTVKLSNTIGLNERNIEPEVGANVMIIDSEQNIYNFDEVNEGVYESVNPFEAALDKTYTLKITTSDGESYSSSPEQIAGINTIDDVELELQTEKGLGISVTAITQGSNSDAQYYRYTFEETYKIVAPLWSPLEVIPISREFPFAVELRFKTVNDQICFNTENSTEIILFDTSGLTENSVDTEVHFLPANDFKIAHRYSILVKQYVQTFEAHSYYSTLKKLSSNENIFTQNQPGFLQGNITSDNDPNQKAVGFFEVASFSSKRIFFNFEDFFTGQERPFIRRCNPTFFPLTEISDSGVVNTTSSPVITLIDSGDFVYVQGLYELVGRPCGDCRVLGSLTKPNFWID